MQKAKIAILTDRKINQTGTTTPGTRTKGLKNIAAATRAPITGMTELKNTQEIMRARVMASQHHAAGTKETTNIQESIALAKPLAPETPAST